MNRRTFQLDQVPTDPPAANPPDLAGYPDTQRLAQGYRESAKEAQKWRETALESQRQLAELSASRTPSTPGHQRPEDTLSEFGLPVASLEELIADRVQRGVAKAFEPLTRGMAARTEVLAQYPDYNKFEADVAQFINSDPHRSQTYQKMFEADPAGALEWGILKFGQSRQRDQSPPPNGEDSTHAQLPNSRAGDARNPGLAETERLAQAFERFQKTGRPDDFIKARLRQAIPDSFFQQ